jgi:2-polyprenyl-3-methyl-5-hydroxy-6-metoxy-1,4-benzoquinol methylase
VIARAVTAVARGRTRTKDACPACASLASIREGADRVTYRDLGSEYRRCSGCGTVYLSPMPDAETLHAMYSSDYLSEHYQTELGGDDRDPELAAERATVLERIAKERPGARVLDVGCGAGRFVSLAREAGLACDGFEPNADAAMLAARKTGARVHSGSVRAVSDRYDFVHLADVLEHVPDPVRMLEEVRSVLARGGEIVARGPLEANRHLFLASMRARRRIRAALHIDRPPWHLSQFTLRGWRALYARASFVASSEQIYEVWWPGPSSFRWTSPQAIIRRASVRLSDSVVGAVFGLGNRVVSWLRSVDNG